MLNLHCNVRCDDLYNASFISIFTQQVNVITNVHTTKIALHYNIFNHDSYFYTAITHLHLLPVPLILHNMYMYVCTCPPPINSTLPSHKSRENTDNVIMLNARELSSNIERSIR